MYFQLLGIFGILATTGLASSSSSTSNNPAPRGPAAAPNPTVTPAALFAVGDNVIAFKSATFDPKLMQNMNLNDPAFTNAHTYTLALAEYEEDVIEVTLWKPPPPGSSVPASPIGDPTMKLWVGSKSVWCGHQ